MPDRSDGSFASEATGATHRDRRPATDVPRRAILCPRTGVRLASRAHIGNQLEPEQPVIGGMEAFAAARNDIALGVGIEFVKPRKRRLGQLALSFADGADDRVVQRLGRVLGRVPTSSRSALLHDGIHDPFGDVDHEFSDP
jgi:hypothetical protein